MKHNQVSVSGGDGKEEALLMPTDATKSQHSISSRTPYAAIVLHRAYCIAFAGIKYSTLHCQYQTFSAEVTNNDLDLIYLSIADVAVIESHIISPRIATVLRTV
jgi:hypothetical protein